jgi:predicted dinucleotide-binding enzyme
MVRYNVGDKIVIKSEPAVKEVRNRKSEYSICYSDTHEAVVILDKLEASVLVMAFNITFAIDRNDIIDYLE